MIKKLAASTALIALLTGGAFASAVNAQSYQGNYNVYYSSQNDGQTFSNQDFQQLLNSYFNSYSFSWKQPAQNDGQTENEQQPESSSQQEAMKEKKVEENVNQASLTQPELEQNEQVSSFEQQVVELTNQERAQYGLKPLQMDGALSKVAEVKSTDMAENNYFSHTSPTYGSPFDMLKQHGISYQSAGENIAKGQQTPQEVVQAWMNSEGHRKNILSTTFTHIGVGYQEQGNVWTQQFIKK